MSGAEIAGLVLGSIPLIISGLEHYGEGIRTIRKISNASREFKRLERILKVENQIFQNCIKALLKDDIDDSTLSHLFAHASEIQKWSDPRIDNCLKRRLRNSYTIYVDCAYGIAGTVERFQQSLELDHNGKGPFTIDKSSFSRALSSLKFGFSLKTYGEMMSEITANNERLERLARSQSEAEGPGAVQSRRTLIPPLGLETAREHAERVFAVLQKAMATTCPVDHAASLYMKAITRPQDDVALRIVMHHPSATHQPPLWSMQEAEIRLIGSAETTVPPALQSRQTLQLGTPGPNASPALQPQAQPEEIQDLCQRLQSMQNSQVGSDLCIGYIASGNSKHGLYCPGKPFVDKDTATTSLAEILGQSSNKLRRIEKRYLVHALTLGMLRLYHTPWLSKQWGRDEIVLFKKGSEIEASHPFISARIPSGRREIGSSSSPQPRYFTPCRPIKEETIFALGLLLIEVALDQPFEKLRQDFLNPDGSRHEFSDLLAADRLIEKVGRAAGLRYAGVVERCVWCNFGQNLASLDDADFRQKVIEGVLLELEQELSDLKNL